MEITLRQRLRDDLVFLYGPVAGAEVFERLAARLDRFQHETPRTSQREVLFDERDVVLITYGDTVTAPGERPLQTLRRFVTRHLADVINTIHILPFYPYSSDDGFSVIDYYVVHAALGTWEDIAAYKSSGWRMMFDLVLNHISAQSAWFRRFVEGDTHYADYFITADPAQDLSSVARPRTLPLLTPVMTASGEKHVWTTFSADQVDLNFANPDTLLDVIDVFLFYIEQGADVLRLDAIAYLWKEIGTACIHLPQTHAVIRLLRTIIEDAAPGVLIITETNVPHAENISYFGSGSDEAHLVYQFALPPLVAHGLITGTARHLTEWARDLQAPSPETTFLNFTASHDGVGVRPVIGILEPDEIDVLMQTTLAHGGRISERTNSDGTTSPYELNITYFDLLNAPDADEPLETQVQRFLVSQAAMLALAGIPGIYFHSLLGSRNYAAGVQQTHAVRTINREKLKLGQVEAALAQAEPRAHQVFAGMTRLLKARTREPAFHPGAAQRILKGNDAVFCVVRTARDGSSMVKALHNFSDSAQRFYPGSDGAHYVEDLLSGRDYTGEAGLQLELAPYEILWLRAVAKQ